MNKAGLCINAESAIWRSRSSYHKTNRHFLVPTMTTSAANTRTINSAHDICVRGIHNNNTKTRFAFAELTRRQRREKIQTQKAVRGKQTKSLRAGEPDRLDKQRRYFSPAQFPPRDKDRKPLPILLPFPSPPPFLPLPPYSLQCQPFPSAHSSPDPSELPNPILRWTGALAKYFPPRHRSLSLLTLFVSLSKTRRYDRLSHLCKSDRLRTIS